MNASTLPAREVSKLARKEPGCLEALQEMRKLHTLDWGDHLVRGGVSSASCLNESSADLTWGEMVPVPGVTWSPPRAKRPVLLLIFV